MVLSVSLPRQVCRPCNRQDQHIWQWEPQHRIINDIPLWISVGHCDRFSFSVTVLVILQRKRDIWWNIRTPLIIDQNRDLQAFTISKKTIKTTPLSSNVIESDNFLSIAFIVEQPSLNLNWLSKRFIPDRW